MPNGTRISLRAARINANMTQDEATKELSKYFGMKISRQRVMKYEENPQQTPPGLSRAFIMDGLKEKLLSMLV